MKKKHTLISILALSMSLAHAEPKIELIVNNTSTVHGLNQTIELPLRDIAMSPEEAQMLQVKDASGQLLPSQVTYDGLLIFQLKFDEAQSHLITLEPSEVKPTFPSKVYGREVPEFNKDWTWENDRVAYRFYNKATESIGFISNGCDVWLKRTPELIINSWYQKMDYHVDHGEGLDYYDVGRTLGSGVLAPLDEKGGLVLGLNYVSGKTLDQGPIRYTVRLEYDPLQLSQGLVSESRTISLDAGSQLNKMKVHFASDKQFAFPAYIGITLREGEQVITSTATSLAYTEPAHPEFGTTHLGILTNTPAKCVEIDKHIGMQLEVQSNQDITFYSGAGWSKYGFTQAQDWASYIQNMAQSLKQYSVIIKKQVNQ